MPAKSASRVVSCTVCKLGRFWIRADDREGTATILCDSCGHPFTTLATEPKPTA